MSVYLANMCLALAYFLANIRNGKPRHVISGNKVHTKFKRMADTDETPYDFSTYENCQVFFKDYANPVYIEPKDQDEYELIPSEKYKAYMEQDLIKQMFAGGQMDLEKLLYVSLATLGLTALIGVIIIAMLA